MRIWGLVPAGLVLPVVAAANDSSSVLGAGGLVFTRTDKVAIEREDLFLSPSEVRVRYEMRNLTAAPVTLRVAFPLPDLPIDTPGGREIHDASGEAVGQNIALPGPVPNFLGFQAQVNGAYVNTETEVRAILPGGHDVTGAIRQVGGWSLILFPRLMVDDPKMLDGPEYDVGPAILARLRALGVVRGDGDAAWPLWRTRIVFHWVQTFPPGVTVIEHRYRPALGAFFFRAEGGAWRGGAAGDPERMEPAYCIDGDGRRTLAALSARSAADNGYLAARTLAYVLATGANWAGPIRTFHLTVDATGKDDAMALVSLCAEVPLTRSGPTRVEGTARDYTPKQNLRVLMVREPS
jgi:hypothetical protein